MSKRYAFNTFFILTLTLLLSQNGMSMGKEDEQDQGKELHLTRIKESYSFLEASLNGLEVNGTHSNYENIKRKISHVDLSTLHETLIKNLKFAKMENIVNLKDVILNCITKTILHITRAMDSILEEVLQYDEFCTTLDKHFSYLYDKNLTIKQVVKSCNRITKKKLMDNYLSLYNDDVNTILAQLKENNIKFQHFDQISNCLHEFYKKITSSFDKYVYETTLYKEFMLNFKDSGNPLVPVNNVKTFLKTLDSNTPEPVILLFFDELFNIYTSNTFSRPCFYVE
ncbi:hypothetical protein, conserved [Plasmodium gonderi]|uniref:Uncharacterized protein n=1 Tax=Plasmodium gonderi TaxID=77519 RepID=A0A1Y1JKV0_PLAGO|nr:hypothetical protein, conserved [Plasmodium gonderi]GAW80664.1 hypothetical protein, conserved [Plasmodium gonderi]